MNNIIVEDNSLLPKRATFGSAGYDFFAPKDIVVKAHSVSELFDTGVKVELDPDKVMMLYIRSSFGMKYGISLANGTGIIDSDYFPNTIKCRLRNDDDYDFTIRAGERFMQGIIIKYYKTDNEELQCVVRTGGIGSTGN